LLNQKTKLATQYVKLRQGTISATQFQQDARAYQANLPEPFRSQSLQSAVTPDCIGQPGGGCFPSSASVGLTQQSQANFYYCGPATASEILIALGSNYSQSFVAGSSSYPGTYLKTAYSGQTSWNPAVMAPTLNSLQGRLYYATQNGSGVSLSQWESDLLTDISTYSQPIAGNTVEYSGGPYLNGHQYAPSNAFPLYHWIAIYGYTNNGQDTTYADSISGRADIWPWAVNVPAYSTISSSNMNTLLSSRGFVW
jgi:hypothetical protein